MPLPTKPAAKKTAPKIYSEAQYQAAIAQGAALSSQTFLAYDSLLGDYKKLNAQLGHQLMKFQALTSLAIASGKI